MQNIEYKEPFRSVLVLTKPGQPVTESINNWLTQASEHASKCLEESHQPLLMILGESEGIIKDFEDLRIRSVNTTAFSDRDVSERKRAELQLLLGLKCDPDIIMSINHEAWRKTLRDGIMSGHSVFCVLESELALEEIAREVSNGYEISEASKSDWEEISDYLDVYDLRNS